MPMSLVLAPYGRPFSGYYCNCNCNCNDKHAGKCLFRDGGGRYPSQTAVKSQPPGNTRTSPRTNLQCKRECRQSLYGSDPKVGVGGPG